MSAFYNCTGLEKLVINNQFLQLDDQAFALTHLSLVSFKGLNNIRCGSDVFPANLNLELSPDYKDQEFCGIEVKKQEIDTSDSDVKASSDIYPDLVTTSDIYPDLVTKSDNNPDLVTTSDQNETPEIDSNPTPKSKKLSKSTIAVIVISCVFVLVVIAFIVAIIFLLRRINNNYNVSDNELSIATQ